MIAYPRPGRITIGQEAARASVLSSQGNQPFGTEGEPLWLGQRGQGLVGM